MISFISNTPKSVSSDIQKPRSWLKNKAHFLVFGNPEETIFLVFDGLLLILITTHIV